MSSAANWKSLKDIFHAALPLNPVERNSLLDSTCGDDIKLRQEVENLLAAHDQAGGFIERSPLDNVAVRAWASHGETQTDPSAAEKPDEVLQQTLRERYSIQSRLGEGGFGTAYLARDLTLSQSSPKLVVVKIPKHAVNSSEWLMKRFRQEIDALVRIDHPGVVGILDCGDLDDGRPFLVMQYVDGISLRTAMAAGPLPPARILRLVNQLAEALDAAHKKGVCHRDLKPENILIREAGTDDERAVIIDFGIATVQEDNSKTGHQTLVVGSLAYMAPEQLAGKPLTASDIYALGRIVVEMATGISAASDSVIEEDLRRVPGNWRRVLRESVSRDPTRRQQTARQLAGELQAPPISSSRRTALGVLAAAAIATPVIWIAKRDSFVPSSGQREFQYSLQFRPDSPRTAFRFHFSSATSGYLYLLNEWPISTESNPQLTTLFPDAGRRTGLVPAGQPLTIPQTWVELDDSKGVERFWIVWSANTLPALDATIQFANSKSQGKIDDDGMARACQRFLHEQKLAIRKPPASDAKFETIEGTGETITYLFTLTH